MFDCYHTETDFASGRRYIPVRRSVGELWLHTEYVADTAADALAAAMLSNVRHLLPEWVAANELVGVAEVDFDIRDLLTLEMLGVSGLSDEDINRTSYDYDCYVTDTDYRSGRRYIPVRQSDGELWLHTEYVADTAADALQAAMLSNVRHLLPEWVAANELVGVAEVDFDIRDLLTLEMLRTPR